MSALMQRFVQNNWSDLWGPMWSCPLLQHDGSLGDGGKWLCGVNQLLQRCAVTSTTLQPVKILDAPSPLASQAVLWHDAASCPLTSSMRMPLQA